MSDYVLNSFWNKLILYGVFRYFLRSDIFRKYAWNHCDKLHTFSVFKFKTIWAWEIQTIILNDKYAERSREKACLLQIYNSN